MHGTIHLTYPNPTQTQNLSLSLSRFFFFFLIIQNAPKREQRPGPNSKFQIPNSNLLLCLFSLSQVLFFFPWVYSSSCLSLSLSVFLVWYWMCLHSQVWTGIWNLVIGFYFIDGFLIWVVFTFKALKGFFFFFLGLFRSLSPDVRYLNSGVVVFFFLMDSWFGFFSPWMVLCFFGFVCSLPGVCFLGFLFWSSKFRFWVFFF